MRRASLIRRLGAALGTVLALAAPVRAATPAAPITQLYLLQNSGWMEPFYHDPQKRFQTLATQLVAVSAKAGAPVAIAAFNKDGQVADRHSPELLFRGPNDRTMVERAIGSIGLPRKASGAYADSDFEAALSAGAKDLLGGRPGIIWFISNNQNAPDGTADWLARSQSFSAALLELPQITRVYAHPVRDEVDSASFGRKEGFLIFALAYGKAAAATLDAIIASDELHSLFRSPVARLKPVDRQTTGFTLDNASVNLSQQNGWIQIAGDGRAQRLKLQGRLENRLYPFVIRSADLLVTFTPDRAQPGLAGMALAARPQHIVDVPALGKSAPVTIELALPALPRLGLLDGERRAAGVMSIALRNIDYGWDPDFLARLSAVPATNVISTRAETQLVASNLPPIFVAPLAIHTSRSDLRLQVIAKYSRWWLWGALAGLVALAIGIWWWLGRQRRSFPFLVDLGGEQHRVTVARGQKLSLANSLGKRFLVLGRGESSPLVKAVSGE